MTSPIAVSASATSDVDSPVRINGMQIAPIVRGDGDAESGTVTVSFTNLAPQAANEVLFLVHDSSGRVIDSYDDRGTFSQGATIRNTFTMRDAHSAPKVDVEKITFVDGSEWVAGQSNPLSRRQAAQSNEAFAMLSATLNEAAR